MSCDKKGFTCEADKERACSLVAERRGMRFLLAQPHFSKVRTPLTRANLAADSVGTAALAYAIRGARGDCFDG